MDNRMITIPEGHICIPIEEYEDMISDMDTLAILRASLLNDAQLGYDGTFLTFDDRIISMALKLTYHHRYMDKIKALTMLREMEKKEESRDE